MTTPATEPPEPPIDRQDALARIRSSGGRVTHAKQSVLDLVFQPGPPRTAEQIADVLDGLDRSIVYRCLHQFEELGIVAHVHPGHGQAVYRRRGLTTVPVACISCGAVTELQHDEVAGFEQLVAEKAGVALDLVHFPLTGRCARCRSSD